MNDAGILRLVSDDPSPTNELAVTVPLNEPVAAVTIPARLILPAPVIP